MQHVYYSMKVHMTNSRVLARLCFAKIKRRKSRITSDLWYSRPYLVCLWLQAVRYFEKFRKSFQPIHAFPQYKSIHLSV